jgi:hypothetical protein
MVDHCIQQAEWESGRPSFDWPEALTPSEQAVAWKRLNINEWLLPVRTPSKSIDRW